MRDKHYFIPIITCLLITLPGRVSAGTLSNIQTLIVTSSPDGIAAADFDGDGDNDMILGYTGANRIWTNNGAGSFSDSAQVLDTAADDITVADFNMDGDIDIVTCRSGSDRLYPNDGAGNFSAYTSITSYVHCLAADVDNDGDPDLILGSTSENIYTNDGSGAFTNTGQSLGSGSTTKFSAGDLDGDGDLDFAASNMSMTVQYFTNDGSGTYSLGGAVGSSVNNQGVVLADVNNDQTIDISVGTWDGYNKVYTNNGSASFTDSGQSISYSGPGICATTYYIMMGDNDNDGDMDMWEVNGQNCQSAIYKNDGAGSFSNFQTNISGGNSSCGYITDIDNDGDLDLLQGNSTGGSKIWRNGEAVANTAPNAPSLTAEPDTTDGSWPGETQAVTLQWTAGGDTETPANLLTYDLRIGTTSSGVDIMGPNPEGSLPGNSGHSLSRLINLEPGTYYWSARTIDTAFRASAWSAEDSFVVIEAFTIGAQSLGGTTDTRVVKTADIDGDGDIDLIESNFGGGSQNYVWKNNGSGTFTQTSPAGDTYGSQGIAPADIDGDGDIDYIEAGFGIDNRIFVNNGSGTFTNSGQALGGAVSSWSIAPADFDNDGDIDFFEGTTDTVANRLWLNDGAGNFSDSGLAINTDFAIDAFSIDLDNDGYLDIAYAVSGAGSRVVLNDGDTTFTDTGMSMAPINTRGMAVGDFNADGFMDLYFTDLSAGGNRVWTNDGDGTFTNTQTLGTAVSSWAFASDLDGDGDTDVAVAVKGGSYQNEIWRNNGTGTFTNSGLTLESYNSWSITGADFNGDGDVDLFEGNQSQTNRVYFNNLNHANSTPAAPPLTDEPDINPVLPYTPPTLAWGTGSDADTPDTDMLGYDVCIGTASGNCDVFGGFFPYPGTYKGASFGNNGANISYYIALHPSIATTYYWTVRTVDPTFKESSWAIEDTFTITPAFEDSGQVLGSINARRSDLADVDGDGDIDVIISCSLCANKVWLNDGAGNFTDSGQSNGGSGTQAATAGDLDGDGDMDYIESTWDNQAERVWLNNGSGSFTYYGQTAQLHYGSNGALGDVDGDGDLDYFENNQNTDPELLWLNNGSASFTVSGTNFGTYSGSWTEMADLDDDGDLDMVLSLGNAVDQLWVNDGTGSFTNSGQSIGFSGGSFVVATDVDGDRDLDLVFNTTGGGLWLNDGSGTFSDSGQTLPDMGYTAESDYDGDGDIDLLGGYGTNVKVSLNDGSGTFSDSGFQLNDISSMCSLKGADFDADGDTDIMIARQWNDNIILVNNLDHANTTPTAPTITAEPDLVTWNNVTDTITLNWAAGSDAETTNPDLLTYDVCVGNNTGECDIYGGFFPYPGAYRSAVFGNAGATTSYSISLPSDTTTTYYWSARTVDATKKSSGWDTEDSFVVAPAFEDSGQSLGAAGTREIIAADLDGDGAHDILAANTITAKKVYLNNGSGIFSDSGQSLTSASTYSGTVFDADGDGDLDFAEGINGSGNKLWLNNSSGIFTDSTQTLGASSNTYAYLGIDVDGDGDIDLVEGNSGQSNSIWLNDGTGTYSNSGQSFSASHSEALAGADLDGDGDVDFFAGNDSGLANKVFLNDGSGAFSATAQSIGSASTQGVFPADVDGDGDFDMIAGNYSGGANKIWINDGSASFSDSGQSLGSYDTMDVFSSDLDGDGDMDFVEVSYNDSDAIWLNDGSGNFSDSGFSFGNTFSYDCVLADLDGDDDIDIAVGMSGANKIWLNNLDPTNTMPNAPTITAEPDGISWGNSITTLNWAAGSDAETTDTDLLTYDVCIGTTTGDCDIYGGFFPYPGAYRSAEFGNAGAAISYSINLNPTNTTTYYWSARTVDATRKSSGWDTEDSFVVAPAFEDSGQSLGGVASTNSIKAADVDGDGDFDIVLGETGTKVLNNNGTGTFSDSAQSLGTSSTMSIFVMDVDGDGDLDFVQGNYNVANQVFLNNGSGTFSDSGQTIGSTLTRSVTGFDADRDGDMDFVEGNETENTKLWLNDGTGSFTDSGQNLGTAKYMHAAVTADVDGDGDTDVIMGDHNRNNYVMKNDGTSTFTSSQALSISATRYVLGLDMDGDGDTDFVEGIESGANKVWSNDGSGSFTDTAQSLGSANTRGLACADLDGDGDIDFADGNYSGANTVWLNDGSGVFSDSGLSLGSSSTWSLATADVNGDGDIDIAEGIIGAANKIWTNNLDYTNTTPNPPAITAEPDVGTYTTTASVQLEWAAGSDAETTNADLLTYDVCVGTATGTCDVYGGLFPYPGTYRSAAFGNAGAAASWIINLPHGTYYWSARTVDTTKKSSAWDTTDSFLVDATLPTTVATINDGTAADITYTSSASQLAANWPASSDPDSGVSYYEVAIGTSSGATDVVTWTNAGTATPTTRTGLSLVDATEYFFSVRPVNGVGLIGSVTTSNGQTVDVTAPAPGTITPSNTDSGTHVDATFDLSATFSDATSGVASCEYCLSTDGTCDTEWTAASWATDTCSVANLTCTNGQGLTLNMRATDNVGNIGTGTPVNRTCDDAAAAADTVTPSSNDDGSYVDGTFDLGTAFLDAGSGVASCEYCLSTDGSCDTEWATGTWGGSACLASGLTCTDGQNLTLNMRTTDNVGNAGAATPVARTCDTVATVAGTVTPANNDDGTYVDGVFDLSATFSDAASGVASCEYCKSTDGTCDGEWTAAIWGGGTCSITNITAIDGDNLTLNMRAADSVGNVGTGTAVMRVCDNGATGPAMNSPAASSWQKEDFTFDVTNSDPGAGLASCYYRVLSNAVETLAWTSYTCSVDPLISVSASGNCRDQAADGCTVEFYVTDNLGNDSTPVSRSFSIDWISPVITGNVTPASQDSGAYVDSPFNMSITSISDTLSGAASCQYCKSTDGNCDTEWAEATWDGGANTCSATSLTCTHGDLLTLDFMISDLAGNSASATPVVRTCDTTAPAPPPAVNDGTGEDISFTGTPIELSANWGAASDGESGVAGYWYSIGTTAGASDTVGWTDNGTATYVTHTGLSLSDKQAYYFSVKAENNVGLISTAVNSNGVTIDATPPYVSIATPSAGTTLSGVAGASGTVYAVNLSSWTLYYGPGESPSSWKEISSGTSNIDDDSLGNWDTSAISGTYTLKLSATDVFSRTAATTTQVVLTNTQAVEGTVTEFTWTIISAPSQPSGSSITDIFGNGEYKIFQWDAEAEADPYLDQYVIPESISAGDGFWVKCYDGDMSYSYQGEVVDTTETYTMPLKQGWNQIGPPFNRSYPWGSVQVSYSGNTYALSTATGMGVVSSTIYSYSHETQSWVPNDTSFEMAAQTGYYVRAYEPVSLLFDPGAGMSGGVARQIRPSPRYIYRIDLSARAGDVSDSGNIIGAVSGAHREFDSFDSPEPPRSMDGIEGNYLTLYFPEESWQRNAGRYAGDIRPPVVETGQPEIWTFNVETNIAGETITIEWDSDALPLEYYSFILENTDTGEQIDMGENSSYSFTAPGYVPSSTTFTVEVTLLKIPGELVKEFTLPAGWNLVSVPLDPVLTSAPTQLADDLPLDNVFQYFEQSIYVSEAADIQAGGAFWIYVDEDTVIDVAGSEPASEVQVPLSQGWNAIGNPFEGELAWGNNIGIELDGDRMTLGNAVDRGLIDSSIFSFENGQYIPLPAGAGLQPWQGYMLKARTECTLVLSE